MVKPCSCWKAKGSTINVQRTLYIQLWSSLFSSGINSWIIAQNKKKILTINWEISQTNVGKEYLVKLNHNLNLVKDVERYPNWKNWKKGDFLLISRLEMSQGDWCHTTRRTGTRYHPWIITLQFTSSVLFIIYFRVSKHWDVELKFQASKRGRHKLKSTVLFSGKRVNRTLYRSATWQLWANWRPMTDLAPSTKPTVKRA